MINRDKWADRWMNGVTVRNIDKHMPENLSEVGQRILEFKVSAQALFRQKFQDSSITVPTHSEEL